MKTLNWRSGILCVVSFFIVLSFAVSVEAKIDPDSMVGLWLFDEGAGKEAKDSASNKYHGQLEGDPARVNGKFGKALEFHGSDYVELKNSSQELHFGAAAPFSITAWVLVKGGGGTVIGKFNGGIIGAYIITISGGGVVGFHREVAPWSLSGAKAIPAGDFGHIAATYDGATMRIYINGKADTDQARGAQNTDLATPVYIGARQTQNKPSEFFTGILDEVAMFNVALTDAQILEVMRGLSPTPAVAASGKLASMWGKVKE